MGIKIYRTEGEKFWAPIIAAVIIIGFIGFAIYGAHNLGNSLNEAIAEYKAQLWNVHISEGGKIIRTYENCDNLEKHKSWGGDTKSITFMYEGKEILLRENFVLEKLWRK